MALKFYLASSISNKRLCKTGHHPLSTKNIIFKCIRTLKLVKLFKKTFFQFEKCISTINQYKYSVKRDRQEYRNLLTKYTKMFS